MMQRRFTLTNAIGLMAAITYVIVFVLMALAWPPSHEPCVKPTAMPATWFGDCREHRGPK